MNKKELIKELAEQTGLKPAQATNVANAFLSIIESQLSAGNEVTLHGFGTFTVKQMPERMGRNPHGNVPVKVAAHGKVVFKPTKRVRGMVK